MGGDCLQRQYQQREAGQSKEAGFPTLDTSWTPFLGHAGRLKGGSKKNRGDDFNLNVDGHGTTLDVFASQRSRLLSRSTG